MPLDPKRIANTAASFLLAADRSLEPRPLGPGQFQILMVPAIVCYAFSIELYLKAIVTLEGGQARGHDLSILFARLSLQSQQAVRTRLSLTDAELDLKLSDGSNAFAEWRYVFESQSINVNQAFLKDMANATKATAEVMLNTTSTAEGS